MATTPPVTPNAPTVPNTPTPNAQGTSNPPNTPITATTSTDPSQGASSTPDQGGTMSAGDMVSNAGASSVQPQTSSSTRTIPTSQQASVQPSTSSTNATLPTQAPKPLPAISPLQPDASHPAVQSASLLYNIATALAGGPRLKTTIDPVTGATTQTPIKLSNADISMAIVSSALSGAFAGLGAKPGPGVVGRAGAAGFGQVQGEMQDADKQNQDQAQQQFKNQVQATAAQGAATEQNSRTILNTAQAERLGIQNLKSSVDQNADLLQSYTDAGVVDGTHISQDDLSAGMKSGKYSATDQIAVPDGWTNINGKNEQTFAIVKNPSAKVPLTQEQWDSFAAAGVPGYNKGTKIPAGGAMVPGSVIANGNAQVQQYNQMKQETSQVSDVLSGSDNPAYNELGQGIDLSKTLNDPQNGPPARQAMGKFQKYISHSDLHGMDLYESLRQMAAPSKPDPNNTGKFIPNTDANSAQTVAGIFGNGDPKRGWQVLQAYHDEQTPEPIKNRAGAESILTDSTSSPKAIDHAKAFIATDDKRIASQKAAKSSGNAGAGTASPQTVSVLGEELARGAITEDQIPNFNKGDTKVQVEAYLSQHHPNLDQNSVFLDGTERKQRDLGRNSIENLNVIQSTLDKRPDLIGVIAGRVSQGKGLTGTNDPDLATINQALDNWALASTGAHGIRSVEARTDAKRDLLNSLKNGPAAVDAAINQSRNSLTQFANLGKPKGVDGSTYVYKQQGPQGSGNNSGLNPNQNGPQLHNGQHMTQVTIPAGASQVRDANKNVIGYMQNGQYTPIGGK